MYRGYKSLYRKLIKKKFCLQGLVQDHHVIPQQFKHNILIQNIIHSPNNLIMMPTPKGIQKLQLRENRLVHWGPHPKYNQFVGYELDLCENYKDVNNLINYLKWEIRYRDIIPWK